MPTLIQDETIRHGSTFQREYTCTNPETGEAMNFAGDAIVAELLTEAGVHAADFTSQVDGGRVLIELDDDDNSALPSSGGKFTHTYYVSATHATLPDYRIAEGRVIVAGQPNKTTP